LFRTRTGERVPLTSMWRRACYDVTKLADASEVQFVGEL
jgi:hypothetical protein